jgi:hypothetical protein
LTNPRRSGPTALSRTVVRDADGTAWHIWEVRPKLAERRRMLDRRAFPRPTPDRRVSADERPMAWATAPEGWLVFQSTHVRRRLAPVPAGWEWMNEKALRTLLASAVISRRRKS